MMHYEFANNEIYHKKLPSLDIRRDKLLSLGISLCYSGVDL
jgi:hypothetical protein